MTQFKHGRTLPTTPFIIVNPQLAAHYLLEGRALVCLVRHGQTDWNLIKRLQGRENVPLNEAGHAQARGLSCVIEATKQNGVMFSYICSSPLSRARDTARYIADSLALPEPVVLDSLIERDYGSLSGLTLAERKQLFPGGERQAGNVESVPAAAARMLSAIDDMLEVSGKKTVIGVTHGGLINAGFSRLTSGEIGTGRTLTVNCSISCVAAGIGEPIPLAYNLQGEGAALYITKLLIHGADI
ncbi:MAG: histidine phosphatase family protein [Clostridiales bacterium]|nr:histidine phosphatase family protein [Clostridiales bacterium]